ncbi:hypothetical protein COY17_02890, partial [Candidatus Saccharibacteria bacterium CG_4_10_14_0_2_um_filter_52_9]
MKFKRKKLIIGFTFFFISLSFFVLTVGFLTQHTAKASAPGTTCQGSTYGCKGAPYPKEGANVSAGDISIHGQYAETNNPASYFEVTDTGLGQDITIKINFKCGAGKLGYKIYIGIYGTSFLPFTQKIDGSNDCAGGEGTGGTSAPATFRIPAGSVQGDGWYAAEVKVEAIDKGGGGHMPFNIIVGGGSVPWISYAADQLYNTKPADTSTWQPEEKPFGLWMAGTNFIFRAPCDVQDVYMKWSGADVGTSYQPESMGMYWDLFDFSTGTVVKKVDTVSGLNGTDSNGNVIYGVTNVVRRVKVSLTGGHKYIWRWRNGSGSNEVVVAMPFTQNNWDQPPNCTPPPPTNTPPTGTIYSLQCNYMKGAVRDPDNTGVA